jgi:hypothetical protein
MPHVFISYSNPDRTVAEQLCGLLERNGFPCWIASRNIPPGSEWPESIEVAIRTSRLMISVVSEHACRSPQMKRELERADRHGIPILPIRLDAAPWIGNFGYFLGNRQWLDLSGRSPDDCESEIVAAVHEVPEGSGTSALAPQNYAPVLSVARSKPGAVVHAIAAELRDVAGIFVTGVLAPGKALEAYNLSDSRTLSRVSDLDLREPCLCAPSHSGLAREPHPLP